MIGELVCLAVLCDFVHAVSTCSYVVESRRVTERSASPDELYFPNPCDITSELKDRWTLDGRAKERMRIRGSTVLVKYRTTRLKYTCVEKRGLVYLLGTSGYLGTTRSVLCLSFAHIMDHPVAEYRITRLNKHGPENHLLSPNPLPEESSNFPGLNETCFLSEKDKYTYALIRRTEKRCTFPDELQRTWNYTFHNAKDVVFSKKTLILNLFKGGTFRFDCSIRDDDLYVLRSPEFTMTELDGVVCFNITKLDDEPFYTYEMSRLNSGTLLEGHVKLIPAGSPTSFEKDCDWLDSPARPEYLY